MEEHPVYRFVITGGPCGGKTTAMSELRTYLSENGFRVFIVPEAATMLFVNGATPEDLAKPECQDAFQAFVINTQIQLEDSYTTYAKSCKQKSVLLCDRGIMDGAAYVSKEMWSEVLARTSMDTVTAREGRYNAIFHLVTAANGAEGSYSLDNNDARHETPSEAILADNNTQAAWHGHPHHIVIDNRNGRPFNQKLAFLKSAISSYVGIATERSRCIHKYKLISVPDVSAFPEHTEVFDVEKVMLSSDGDLMEPPAPSGTERILYSFLRKRSQGPSTAYGLTTVKILASGDVVHLKCIISSRMYASLLATKVDPKRHIVKQRRYCFRYENQAFHVSQWLEPEGVSDLCMCVVQCETDPRMPDFLQAGPELTATPSQGKEYSFREMSLKKEEKE